MEFALTQYNEARRAATDTYNTAIRAAAQRRQRAVDLADEAYEQARLTAELGLAVDNGLAASAYLDAMAGAGDEPPF